jgi:hypothetical protein
MKNFSAMLCLETDRKLKNLLLGVGEGEKDLEIARQKLCQIKDFSPKDAFDRLDRLKTGYLTQNEFVNFFRDNSVYHVTHDEAI